MFPGATMDYFVIEGGRQLRGTVTPVGNKNAALPLLAAALLTDEPLTLRNIPDIGDVRTKIQLMRRLGVEVEEEGGGTLRLAAGGARHNEPEPRLSRGIRTAPLRSE